MSSRSFLLLTTTTFFAAGAAWAATSHSVDVTLTSATTVNGKVIPAGDYRFSWTGDTNKVDVTIEHQNEVVAQAPATVKERPKASRQEEVIARTTKSGSQVLEELRLRGEKTALVFSAS
jgi:hypothetical protein